MADGCPTHTFVWLGDDDLEFLTYYTKLIKTICFRKVSRNIFLEDLKSLKLITLGADLPKDVFVTVTTIL